MRAAINLVLLLIFLTTQAAAADLVADLNQQMKSVSSYPRNFMAVGSTLFFTAVDAVHGRELWKSDGTVAGTILVKDIRPGSSGSKASYSADVDRDRAPMGGILYFAADDGEKGTVLWKTNGTPDGTTVVEDVPVDLAGALPYDLTVVGNSLFFTAQDPLHGRELWKTDGTSAGTGMIRDLLNGPDTASPEKLTAVGSLLMFRTTNNPRKLWRSDGTPQGTVPIAASQSYPSSSIYPDKLATMGEVLYFVGEDIYGPDLWRTDGTEAGTRMVRQSGPFRNSPGSLMVAGSRLYFPAILTLSEINYGYELWQSDGTSAGTGQIKDINPGGDHSSPDYLAASGNTLYFFADDGVHGKELWKSGGAAGSTLMIKDLNPGPMGTQAASSMVTLNGLLYFFASKAGGGYALWRSDGTATGTEIVKGITLGYDPEARFHLTAAGNKMFFSWNDGVHGEELWISDGTEAGTVLVDINSGNADSSPGNLLPAGEQLIFTANENAAGAGLWKSNGTRLGTQHVHLIPKGAGQSALQLVAADNGTVFFNNGNGIDPPLWKTDGTAGGTLALTPSAKELFQPGNLTIGGNTLFFTATGQNKGNELYWSDGTMAGTRLLKDIFPGPEWSSPFLLTLVNDSLFFVASGPSHLSELWKSDGSEAGSLMVKSLGGPEVNPGNFTSSNGLLYFTRGATDAPKELWKSDGTEAGTTLITATHPANPGVLISNLTDWNAKVYFTAYNPTNSTGELWRTDGTVEGTTFLKSIPECASTLALHSLTPADSQLFFGHEGRFGFRGGGFGRLGSGDGYTLWRTDGTSGGTMAVRGFPTVEPHRGSRKFEAVGSAVYFAGYDRGHGMELWRSDGSSNGTFLVADLADGSGSSSPDNLQAVGGKLYFSATTQSTGRELWSIPLAPPGLVVTGEANLVRNGSSLPETSNGTDFGGVSLPANSVTREFHISNTGGMASAIERIVLSGAAAGDFSVVSHPATPLPAGGATACRIMFSPSAAGIRRAVVEIKYGLAGAESYTFAISGGVQAGGIRGEWRMQYFGSPENLGNAADGEDPDQDGISNYLEWTFHLNPTEGSGRPAVTGLQGASFVYSCGLSLAALNAGTLFSLEWSNSLSEGPWSNAGVTQEIISSDAMVRWVRFLGPVDGSPHRYFRLKVTSP